MKNLMLLFFITILFTGCGIKEISKCLKINNPYDQATCIKKVALKTGKIKLCEEIKYDDKYEGSGRQCRSEVAKKYKDIKLCKQLKKDWRTGCYQSIASETKNIDVCENIVDDKIGRIACYKDIARLTNNKNYCDKIVGQNYIEQCYNDLPNTKGEEACDDFADNSAKHSCLSKLANKNNDINQCYKISSEHKQGLCIRNIALNKNDYSICDNIKDNIFMAQCYEVFARKNNPSICSNLKTPELIDSCYKHVAVTIKDSEICERISDASIKRDCMTFSK